MSFKTWAFQLRARLHFFFFFLKSVIFLYTAYKVPAKRSRVWVGGPWTVTSVLIGHSDIRGCSQINFSLPTTAHKCATSFLYFHSEEETQWSFLENVLLFSLVILDQNWKEKRESKYGGECHGPERKHHHKHPREKSGKKKKHRELAGMASARQHATQKLQVRQTGLPKVWICDLSQPLGILFQWQSIPGGSIVLCLDPEVPSTHAFQEAELTEILH